MKKVNMILGTDWWTDCDDVVATRIMARKHKQGVIELCGVCLNACMEHSAASLSAFLQSEGLKVPIGLDVEGTDFGYDIGRPMYQINLAKNPHYMTNDKCEDGVKLYRRILSADDRMFDIVEIGYPQVLANLLKSGPDEYSPLSGSELVKKKVNKLWMMAGNWEKDIGKENNFCRNKRSSEGGSYVCDNWPTEITFLGWEIGNTVITGSKLKDDKDLLKIAMTDIGHKDGRSSWDPMLCLMACMQSEKDAGYDIVRGTAAVNAETGENTFEKNSSGKHCFVIKKYADSYYSDMIDELL